MLIEEILPQELNVIEKRIAAAEVMADDGVSVLIPVRFARAMLDTYAPRDESEIERLEGEIEDLEGEVTELKDEIKALEDQGGDAKELQAELDELRAGMKSGVVTTGKAKR